MTFLTANNSDYSHTFITSSMTHRFHSNSSTMPHGTPPGFEPGPPAPEASILTTRPWLTDKNQFPKKFIDDIPMVRVSRSIF